MLMKTRTTTTLFITFRTTCKWNTVLVVVPEFIYVPINRLYTALLVDDKIFCGLRGLRGNKDPFDLIVHKGICLNYSVWSHNRQRRRRRMAESSEGWMVDKRDLYFVNHSRVYKSDLLTPINSTNCRGAPANNSNQQYQPE